MSLNPRNYFWYLCVRLIILIAFLIYILMSHGAGLLVALCLILIALSVWQLKSAYPHFKESRTNTD
ncbi:hypothetical protein GP475_05795 [Corynebacterium poyangense]|uniref:Uncharacterized protein n=1 Tax=Corynebacterium poyangense TaxID=2684405 RepID=A0A7H0SNT2_9CORY|nr:hypothetical protein [Corynebacterium poyangense]MBZ8177757.1 hypothetical protein [Corynebacterium poyangense]QNQ90207.1 hypothetical protein GP475_05795 [Corynebacterium poyangense]